MSTRLVEAVHRRIVGHGANPVARLEALVGYVRNIPFRFDPTLADPETGPLRLLAGETGGSCTPKHYALALLLHQERMWRAASNLPELRVQYLTYPFRFRQVMQFPDGRVAFPAHVAIGKVPEGHHAALGVYLGEVGRELRVDVTWDPLLSRAGFPVAHPWDAKRDMPLAVPYGGETLRAASLKQKLLQLKYLKTRPEFDPGECESPEELQQILDAANEWFCSIRRGTA